MSARAFTSRILLVFCCSWGLVSLGCGGKSVATTAKLPPEEERVEAHTKTLLEPVPEEPMEAQGLRLKQQFACAQLKALGPRAASALPALEKLQRETQDEDLKKFTADALAAIRK